MAFNLYNGLLYMCFRSSNDIVQSSLYTDKSDVYSVKSSFTKLSTIMHYKGIVPLKKSFTLRPVIRIPR